MFELRRQQSRTPQLIARCTIPERVTGCLGSQQLLPGIPGIMPMADAFDLPVFAWAHLPKDGSAANTSAATPAE
jgi:hypothetical protein